MDNEVIERCRATAEHPFTLDRESVAGDEAEWQNTDSDQALRVLSGLGGFLSSLLFLLFLWLADILTQPVIAVAMGVVLLVVTVLLGRTRQQAFLATITVCGYLVGVNLIMVGLPPSIPTEYLVLPVLGIAFATIAFTWNYYLVLLATASIPACLIFLHIVLKSPIWTWLALLLCSVALLVVNRYEHRFISDRRLFPFRTGMAAGLMLSLVWFRWAGTFDPSIGDTHTVLPLFLGSLFLLLISFRNQHFLGLGLGIAGLFYFTVQYYYDLRWDLLNKSVSLIGVGAGLLLAYFFIHRKNRQQP